LVNPEDQVLSSRGRRVRASKKITDGFRRPCVPRSSTWPPARARRWPLWATQRTVTAEYRSIPFCFDESRSHWTSCDPRGEDVIAGRSRHDSRFRRSGRLLCPKLGQRGPCRRRGQISFAVDTKSIRQLESRNQECLPSYAPPRSPLPFVPARLGRALHKSLGDERRRHCEIEANHPF
jgi:hypothetical protein